MSALKSAGIAVATAGLIGGLLFGTGIISLKKSDEAGEKKKAGRGGVDPELESLSYLNAVEMTDDEKKKQGVTRHDPARAEAGGIGLGTPIGSGDEFRKIGGGKPLRIARLIGMDGQEIHAWKDDVVRGKAKNPGWAMAKFSADGHLYAVDNRIALVKLDWDSKAAWDVKGRFHHDLEFREDGGIIVLEERLHELDDQGEPYHLLDDGFTWISADGEVEKRFWIHDALADEDFYKAHVGARNDKWRSHRKSRGTSLPRADFIHANTVEILDRDIEGVGSRGDVLTGLRELDMIAVFSAEDGSLKWRWGAGELDRPHDPDQLADGTILVFDNGWHRHWSRVLELNPVGNEIVWTYRGTKADPLWSKKRGLSQVLGNGNIVINATQRGRILEVTREGDVVWEYFSPDILGDYRIPMRYVRLQGSALQKAKELIDTRGGTPGEPIKKRHRRKRRG